MIKFAFLFLMMYICSPLFSQGITFEAHGDSLKVIAPFNYTASTTPYYYSYKWKWGITLNGRYRVSTETRYFRTGIGNYEIKNFIVLPKRPDWIQVEITKENGSFVFPLGDTLGTIETLPLPKIDSLKPKGL